MTCKYAFDSGVITTLNKIREFVNKTAEENSRRVKEIDSGKTDWWRIQGENDFSYKLMDELSRILLKVNE